MRLAKIRPAVARGLSRYLLQAGALMSIVMVLLLLGTAEAGVPAVTSWFDDFNDGNATDGNGPMSWDPNPYVIVPLLGVDQRFFPGTYDESSGDYLLKGNDEQEFQNPSGFANDEEVLVVNAPDTSFANGTSVRTRVRIDRLGGVGLTANTALQRDPVFPNANWIGYYGLFHVVKNGAGELSSNYEIGRMDPLQGLIKFVEDDIPVDPNDPNQPLYPRVTPPEVPVDQDIVIQLDAMDNLLSFTVWTAGEPQPAEPQVTIEDTSGIDFLAGGTAGLLFNENSYNNDSAEEGEAWFRYAKASSVRLLDGDMETDGDVDFDDIPFFVQALTDKDGYLAQFGLPSLMMGDTDNDGDHDFDDISIFVVSLGGGLDSSASGIPEPSTLVLTAIGLLGIGLLRRRRR